MKYISTPIRGKIVKSIFEKIGYENLTGRQVFHWLKNEIGFKSITGKDNLSIGNFYVILRNSFYYGEFEFPRGSGNWYKGKHTPLINKELFDLVQSKIKNHIIDYSSKEFAFTKLMTCGICGSGITADEKFKKLKNGEKKDMYIINVQKSEILIVYQKVSMKKT